MITATHGIIASSGGGGGFDPDALAYITAVETVDGESLETDVKTAINDFVVGCKSDGIWTAIKASCILAGARTLAGALVPLAGTAPTNFNFGSADYDRKTGLKGNASTKYLDTNHLNEATPQDNNHLSVYITATSNGAIIGCGISNTGSNLIFQNGAIVATRSRSAAFNSLTSIISGFSSINRADSTQYDLRANGANYNYTTASDGIYAGNVFLFARQVSGSASNLFGGRLSFYSIGESIDLALFDTRITALMNAYNLII